MLIPFYLWERKPLYNSKNDPEMAGPQVSIIKRFHCSLDCHVSITFQPFLPGLVCLSSARLIPSQGQSSPVNVFIRTLGNMRWHDWVQIQHCQYNFIIYFMSQIYGMESPINTAQPPTVWDSHMSMIKRGLPTLTQLTSHTIETSLS